MPRFYEYFTKQWIESTSEDGVWKRSKFVNWQLFNTPAGLFFWVIYNQISIIY